MPTPARNTAKRKKQKKGRETRKSGAKKPNTHVSFFTFRTHFCVFRDRCIADLMCSNNTSKITGVLDSIRVRQPELDGTHYTIKKKKSSYTK